MRFQVPQFIEVEDKIFGPLSLRQFIYLAGSAGIIVIMWALLPLPFFFVILLAAPIAGLGAALAFLKINNRPFINILESAFSYALSNRLYIWKKRDKKVEAKAVQEVVGHISPLSVPTLSENKLKDLAWNLDIKESIYSNKLQQK
ncbi:MAG TPA: PrgI family protein [Candidatus Paceibacterota bacterium]